MVISAAYREFYAAVATSAAALTGLLFVALSVAPRLRPEAGPAVIQEVRAAAALTAFFNALAVPLFALVPDMTIKYPAVVTGVGGIMFTAAGTRSIWSSSATSRQRLRQVGLGTLLLLIFGTQLIAGIALLVNPDRSTPVQLISDTLVASLLVGVARAWELVGARDTGIFASLAILSHRLPGPGHATDAAGSEEDGAASTGREPGPREASS